MRTARPALLVTIVGVVCAVAAAIVVANAIAVPSARAQIPGGQPAVGCCTRAVRCPLPSPSFPGQPCVCMTPWGPVGGYAC